MKQFLLNIWNAQRNAAKVGLQRKKFERIAAGVMSGQIEPGSQPWVDFGVQMASLERRAAQQKFDSISDSVAKECLDAVSKSDRGACTLGDLYKIAASMEEDRK